MHGNTESGQAWQNGAAHAGEPIWFVARDGAQRGPFSESQVVGFHRDGGLRPTDHLWTEALGDWRSVADLLGAPPAPAAPNPMPAAPSVAPPPPPSAAEAAAHTPAPVAPAPVAPSPVMPAAPSPQFNATATEPPPNHARQSHAAPQVTSYGAAQVANPQPQQNSQHTATQTPMQTHSASFGSNTQPNGEDGSFKFSTVIFLILGLIVPLWPISLPLFWYLAYQSYKKPA